MTNRTILFTVVITIATAFLYDISKILIPSLANSIFELLFFCFESLEQLIYSEIALGYREKYSLFLYVSIYSGPIILFLTLYVLNRTNRSDKLLNEVSSKKQKSYLLILGVFLGSYLLFMANKEIYVNDKITCFNHKFTIIAPYVVENQRLLIKSNFAQVKNSNDYKSIITSMESISDENNLNTETINKCKKFDILNNSNGY